MQPLRRRLELSAKPCIVLWAPAEAASLSLEPEFGGLRHLRPFAREPKPSLLVERVHRTLGLLSALVSLLAKSGGVVGHVGEDTG